MFSCKSTLSFINTSGHESCDVGTLEFFLKIKRLYKYLQSPFSFCKIFSNSSSSNFEGDSTCSLIRFFHGIAESKLLYCMIDNYILHIVRHM